MIMFKEQKQYDLSQEEKIIILGSPSDSKLAAAIFTALDYDPESLEGAFECLNPLKKLKAKALIVLNTEKFDDISTVDEPFKGIQNLKNDALVLVDTFKETHHSLLAEKLGVHHYKFTEFKTDKGALKTIHYHGNDLTAFNQGIILSEAINFTRDLVNRPYNALNAEKLADIALTFADIDNVTVKVLEKADCETMGMGAFLGVNKGSKDAPKLIHITYKGDAGSQENTALVGKGVMYDTGGYSLKGVQSMPTMKMDMGGAATVLGAMRAIANLRLNANVSVVIAATDNKIGDDAIVPDDVLVSAQGTTIEIISTDAEGRLTLADALWYAQKEGATRMIDVATLTGAVVAALGDEYVGAFTNNETFYQALGASAKISREHVWLLPIGNAHRKSIESQVADLKNSGGRLGGASIAAAFLDNFVNKEIPWVHLDIAGTAYKKESGATGVMVKTLTNPLN